MKKPVNIPSMYGPVKIELTLCDGPECTNCNQEDHMVGWYKLETQGISVTMTASPPDEMDFCSMECLRKAASIMTGRDPE